jgi:lycopene cyclase domain-containing protein
MFEFIVWLSVFIWIPTVILWIKYHKILMKYKNTLMFVVLGSIPFGIIWEHIAIKDNIWFYPGNNILNKWIWGVPVEEWLFILSFPWMVFTLSILLNKMFYKR